MVKKIRLQNRKTTWYAIKKDINYRGLLAIFNVKNLVKNINCKRSTVIRYRQLLTDCGYIKKLEKLHMYKVIKYIPWSLSTIALNEERDKTIYNRNRRESK